MPEAVDVNDSDDEYSSDDDDRDDEDNLHEPCGIPTANADIYPWECLISKLIAKEFLPTLGHIKERYASEVVDYNQDTKKYTVKYYNGEVMERYDHKGVMELRAKFENW